MSENQEPYNNVEVGNFEGKVMVEKPKPFSRFLKRFVKRDMRKIETYIKDDIIKPRLAEGIYDIFTNALAMFLFDDDYESSTSGSLRSSYGRNKSAYRDYAKTSKTGGRRVKSEPPEEEEDRINKYEVKTIYFESKRDALDTLDYMRRYIDKYDSISVAAYYSYVKAPSEWSYNRYGWTDLRDARAVVIRGGRYWTLSLPALEYLEDN